MGVQSWLQGMGLPLIGAMEAEDYVRASGGLALRTKTATDPPC